MVSARRSPSGVRLACVRRGGPGRQSATAAASCTRAEAHILQTERHHAPGKDDDDGRGRVVPDVDHGVPVARIVRRSIKSQHGVAAGSPAERRPERRERWRPLPERCPRWTSVAGFSIASGTLPGRIDGSGATPGGRGQVRKHTCPRTRTRPLDWGVAPTTAGAARPGRVGARRCRVVAYSVARVRIAGGPKCASAPRVVCALQCGHETRAGRHR